MNREKLLLEIKNRLINIYGERFKGLVLYGSEAKNEAKLDSDIDILVLLTGPVSRLEEHRIIMSKIYDLVLDIERPIHAKPVDIAIYDIKGYPLYQSAKSEGIMV